MSRDSAVGMFSTSTSIVTLCRLDNSSQKPAAALSSPKISSFAG